MTAISTRIKPLISKVKSTQLSSGHACRVTAAKASKAPAATRLVAMRNRLTTHAHEKVVALLSAIGQEVAMAPF
jgi:hypothetical protein